MKDAASSYLEEIVACAGLAFVLSVISFSIISLIGQPFAWAVEAHSAHSSSASISPLTAASSPPAGNNQNPAANNNRPPIPTIINGQWYCQSPYTTLATPVSKDPTGNVVFGEICVLNSLSFPCSDRQDPNGRLQPNENVIKLDWLSGDIPLPNVAPDAPHNAGHFMYTYPTDTYAFPQIATFFGFMEGLSFALMVPSMMLMGYNLLLGASTFRYAGSLEGLSRLMLGALAVGASFTLVQMLINLETTMAMAINQLHTEFPFPQTTVNGMQIPYMLASESSKAFSGSYRGLVVPMSRWGCATNDFIGIFSPQFISGTLAPVIPIIGNFTHLAGTVTTLPDLIHRIGELVRTVMSILLWIQVFIRIILINYYILMAPLSFSCWVLPGGAGQRIVGTWFRGFFVVLFVQILQLFILTTLPLILPALPQIPSDSVGILQGFLVEFPPILTLFATLMAPTLIGVSAGKVLGTASSMAGQTIVVLGTAASQIV
jgi:hypothetical protein